MDSLEATDGLVRFEEKRILRYFQDETNLAPGICNEICSCHFKEKTDIIHYSYFSSKHLLGHFMTEH